ncbi:MAG: aminotransferase class I/II-fold pyridoxal phosphate-dependent enzyme, partial [Candidatus Hydrothermarchaeales archaeon]
EKLWTENGIKTDEEELIVTSGASEALALALLAVVNPGDEVLIPDPGFVSYAPLIRTASGVPVPFKVKVEDEFEYALDEIEARINDNTRAIIINSPGNPTGAVLSKDVIKGVAEICEKRELFVISDEVYEKIIYKGHHYSIGKYTDWAITVNGFSKSYAMTGLRLGYVQSKLETIEEMLKVHQYLQASTNSLSQRAALAALKDDERFIEEMKRVFRERRGLIVDLLNDIPGVRCLKPKGAFYVFPDFSEHGDCRALCMRFLKEARVVTTPGTAFGENGEGYIRFSYASSTSSIGEGVGRIRDVLL